MDPAAAAARGLLARALARDGCAALVAGGIEPMPLKGVLFAALGVPGSETRWVGDVDLLVPEPRRGDAVAALVRAGLRVVARAPHATTLWSERHTMHLDLHARLFARGWFALDADGVRARATPDAAWLGVPVRLMAPVDVYAHLVGHFVAGRLSADDARHVADFGAVASHLALDPRRVAAHLVSHGLGRAARYVLRETATGAHRRFARDVLAALPADRAGDALALLSHAVFGRWPGNDKRAAVVARLYTL